MHLRTWVEAHPTEMGNELEPAGFVDSRSSFEMQPFFLNCPHGEHQINTRRLPHNNLPIRCETRSNIKDFLAQSRNPPFGL